MDPLVKIFLKALAFQETRANSTVSNETHMAIFSLLQYRQNEKVLRSFVHKKNAREQPLWGIVVPQIEMFSEITKNSQETVRDAATFSKFVSICQIFRRALKFHKWAPYGKSSTREDHVATNAWSGKR